MKSLLKPVFLSTALTTLGLCCTISNASALSPADKIEGQMLASYQVQGLLITNQADTQLLASHEDAFANLLTKPLARLASNVVPEATPIATGKKNEFFEIAAIFNDRLQQFIAHFQKADDSHAAAKTESDDDKLFSSCKSSRS
mgnify:CR=1 FL=1